MFSCSLTQGIDLPWESRAHLAKIRAEVRVRGVPMSFWRTQLLSAELTKDQSTLFLPALVSYSPGLASCCHREHSLLWLPLLLLALTVCREEEKEIAHQWNGGRLWWERRACLDYRTLTAGSRKGGNHCDMANKCTTRVGAVLTRYLLHSELAKEEIRKPIDQLTN